MKGILVVGVNHTTAPVEMREKMALSTEKMKDVMAILHRYLGDTVVLSTCNRTEIYAIGEDPLQDSQRLVQFLSEYHHLPKGEFTSRLYTYVHEEAIRHLFQVVCGLDSMVFGEEQILVQVRRALEVAQSNGKLSQPLGHIFRHALRVGKRARTETGISRYAVSVSHACATLAQQVLGDLTKATILIISAGEMGKLTGKIVRDSGIRHILVANRTHERALALAQQLGGRAIPWEQLDQALVTADIVVSASGAPGFILGTEAVAQAMKLRPQRPLILVDIAVPRDIDPEVKKLDNVCLYDIDDLQEFSNNSLEERKREGLKVDSIIDSEVALSLRWWNHLEVLPTITALRRRAEAVRQKELMKTLRKLPHLSPEEQARLDALTRAIMNKMLHHPTVCLKDNNRGHRFLPFVKELFDLKDGE